MQINPVYFNFKKHSTPEPKRQIGFIAQEVQPLFPEIVSVSHNGKLAMDYPKMTAVLLQAVKEQQKVIEEQNKKNQELQEQLNSIIERLEKLENE